MMATLNIEGKPSCSWHVKILRHGIAHDAPQLLCCSYTDATGFLPAVWGFICRQIRWLRGEVVMNLAASG